MSIVQTSLDNRMANEVTGFLGKKYEIPYYIQFVPGSVVHVIPTETHLFGQNEGDFINTIMAIPHYGNKSDKRKIDVGKEDRYFPLLRGIVDVPAKGDPVLLCKIGGVQYYLGPLNTGNDVNWNDDTLSTPESSVSPDLEKVPETNKQKLLGESLNFRKVDYQRMQKYFNNKLDGYEEGKSTIGEIHGDMMLEGRHGNSIRIGSRDVNPYIFLSNGRYKHERTENVFAGSLITLIKKGSLRDHFGVYRVAKTEKPVTEEATDRIAEELPGFILASDKQVKEDGDNKNKHLMSSIIKSVNELDNVENQIYNYGNNDFENQVFITSDRLTFNSRREDIYMSSHQDIHIGTRRHLTISTKEKVIIETEGFNIGNPNKTENKDKMEPIVLGNQLQEILREMLNLLSTASIYMFCPTPLTDLKGQPIGPKFGELLGKLDSIISNKHFIEPKNK
tara:strand:- start:3107 stop:4450 length:1344 start_codon:yes stop_codon:yes gene_type:complete